MATTTNFGWETPDDSDLVKDGALAMRTLGNAIDTSLVDLKGGTTGQNLRKNSNTDMDFIWAGDATNTVIDAEGDLLVGDSADTLQRLAIGTTGQVLTVDTSVDGKIKWAAAAGGGKVLQVVQATYTTQTSNSTDVLADTGLTATITPSAATSKILVLAHHNGVSKSSGNANNAVQIELYRGASTSLATVFAGYTGTTLRVDIGTNVITYLDSPSTTSATTYKTRFKNGGTNAASVTVQQDGAFSSMTLIEVGA
jgi:hypothetical protein